MNIFHGKYILINTSLVNALLTFILVFVRKIRLEELRGHKVALVISFDFQFLLLSSSQCSTLSDKLFNKNSGKQSNLFSFSHTWKCGPDRFSRFDVYRFTNKQTETQTDKHVELREHNFFFLNFITLSTLLYISLYSPSSNSSPLISPLLHHSTFSSHTYSSFIPLE